MKWFNIYTWINQTIVVSTAWLGSKDSIDDSFDKYETMVFYQQPRSEDELLHGFPYPHSSLTHSKISSIECERHPMLETSLSIHARLVLKYTKLYTNDCPSNGYPEVVEGLDYDVDLF